MTDDGKVEVDVTIRVMGISPKMRRHYRELRTSWFGRQYANFLIAGAVYVTGDGSLEIKGGKHGWSRDV